VGMLSESVSNKNGVIEAVSYRYNLVDPKDDDCTCGGVISSAANSRRSRRCLFCRYLRNGTRLTEEEARQREDVTVFRRVRLEDRVYTIPGWCE